MSTSFRDHLNERLQDPEFKAEWDALEPEFNIKAAIIAARRNQGDTPWEARERALAGWIEKSFGGKPLA